MPAKSFLYDDISTTTSEPICHIGVVKHNIVGDGHFVLGQVFMENFYVAFDASNDESNRIGLSYHVSGEPYETVVPEVPNVKDDLDSLVTMIVLLCIVIAIILAIVFLCYCLKRRQKERLAKAKAYFSSLETNNGDDNRLDRDDELEAQLCEQEEDPNNRLQQQDHQQTVGDLI